MSAAHGHDEMLRKLVEWVCRDSDFAVPETIEGLGGAPSDGVMLVALEAVVGKLRACDAGVEVCWLTGPPDGVPGVKFRRVIAWERLATEQGKWDAAVEVKRYARCLVPPLRRGAPWQIRMVRW